MATTYGDDLTRRVTELLRRCGAKPGMWAALCQKHPDSDDSDLGGDSGTMTLKRAVYFAERERGVEHVWAVMTASRKGPCLNTDVMLFEGKRFLGDGMMPAQLKGLVSDARKNGYNPSQSDTYIPALAAFPGDPAAFVPATGGRGHVRRVLEARNWSCDGAVKRDSERRGDHVLPDGHVLAPDLAMEAVMEAGIPASELKKHGPDILADMTKKRGFSNKVLPTEISAETHQITPRVASKPRSPRTKGAK